MTTTQAPVTQAVTQHPFEVARARYDEIIASPTLSRVEKLQALQEQFNTLGETVKSEIDRTAPPDISEAITKAMTPIVDQLNIIAQKMSGQIAAQPQAQPQQKSFAPAPSVVNPTGPAGQPQLPVSPVTGQPSKLTAIIRRSAGIQQ